VHITETSPLTASVALTEYVTMEPKKSPALTEKESGVIITGAFVSGGVVSKIGEPS